MATTDIATKIRNHVPKVPLRETTANKDTVQKLAGQHQVETVAGLRKIANDPRAPATARVSAYKELLDRTAGKAAKNDADDKRPEDAYSRMSEGQLVAEICNSLWHLSPEVRAAIAETLLMAERGFKIDAEQMGRDFDQEAAEQAKAQLPPLEKRPRKEPRR